MQIIELTIAVVIPNWNKRRTNSESHIFEQKPIYFRNYWIAAKFQFTHRIINRSLEASIFTTYDSFNYYHYDKQKKKKNKNKIPFQSFIVLIYSGLLTLVWKKLISILNDQFYHFIIWTMELSAHRNKKNGIKIIFYWCIRTYQLIFFSFKALTYSANRLLHNYNRNRYICIKNKIVFQECVVMIAHTPHIFSRKSKEKENRIISLW